MNKREMIKTLLKYYQYPVNSNRSADFIKKALEKLRKKNPKAEK